MTPHPYRLLLIGLFGWLVTCTSAQGQFKPFSWIKRATKNFLNDSLPPDKPRFLVYPTLVYAPETSLEIGFSSLLLYHAKNKYLENRLSEVQAFTFFTLKSQYGLWLDHALYGDQDKWFFLGRERIQRFPLLYFGIGPETSSENPAIIDASAILIRERVLRNITGNLFFGLEVDYQQLYSVNFGQPETNPFALPLGSQGSRNLGFGAGVVYDNRHNPLNTRKGQFTELAFLNYRKLWGSHFDFQGVNFDARMFRPFRKNVLAIQASGTFMTGDVPFNQMALLGGDVLMRGYYAGRYRDRNYLSAQVEYRWLPFSFSKRIGGAAFLAAGAVTPAISEFSFRKILPSGGLGLRYLLFPQKDIFLRFDVGLTAEGLNFYIYSGEAF
jgi:hypothetical protein